MENAGCGLHAEAAPSHARTSKRCACALAECERTHKYTATPVAHPENHRVKDAVSTYVERALSLHDARGGNPVVFPPEWTPKPKNKSRGES